MSRAISRQIFGAILLACAALPVAANDDFLPELKKGQPKDVRILIDRISICNHLAGEVGGDKESMKELLSAMRQYRCHALPADEARLLRKYKRDKQLPELLETARTTP